MSLHSQMRRVKTIFSVIASQSRLEILKILNAKGSMSYSELKQQTGFRSKKESGKFAYHLRKLLKQNLIAQNKAEKKYMLTSLGRLVLTAAKQIEEQALIESGRLYVRTSSQKMEEFDPSKITQSLVKEAGVPLEIAQRVASEAESRVYKFQTSFLTASLIRELVNSILIEQGHEQYWRMLTRVGMPVYDVSEILEKAGSSQKAQEDVVYYTAGKVFSEYLIQSRLPPDVADAHLNGEIHIPWTFTWELKPEAVVVDFEAVRNMDIGLKLPSLPREDVKDLFKLIYALSREVSSEIYVRNAFENIKDDFLGALKQLSLALPSYLNSPMITLEIEEPDGEVLEAFVKYSLETPIPKVSLALSKNSDLTSRILDGGNPVVLNGDGGATLNGMYYDEKKPLNILLHGVSINLPRMAMESHKDEVYFRAKVAMLLDTIVNALNYRLESLTMHIRGGLLPSLNSLLEREPPAYMRMSVNMTGLEEAIGLLQPTSKEKVVYKKKVIETVKEHIIEKFDGPVFVSLISDDGGTRLAQLDLEGKGRGRVKMALKDGYSQGYRITLNTTKEMMSEIEELAKVLDGGMNIEVRAGMTHFSSTMDKVRVMPHFRLTAKMGVCTHCGWNNPLHIEKCRHCGGPVVATR